MKNENRFAPLLAFTATLPLPLCLAALRFDGRWLLSLVPGVLFAAAAPAAERVKGKKRIIPFSLFMIFEVLTGLLVLPLSAGIWRFLPAVLYTAVLFILLASRLERDLLLWRLGIAGVVLFSVSQIALFLCALTSPLRSAGQPLFAAFIAFAFTAVPLLNRAEFRRAAGEKEGLPGSVRRRGTLLTLVFLTAVFLLSSLRRVGELFALLFSTVKNAAVFLFELLCRLFSFSETSGGAPAADGDGVMSALEGGEPSAFWNVMEKVLLAAGILLLLCLLVRLAARSLRTLKKLFFAFRERVKRCFETGDEGYTDEVSDIRGEERKHAGRHTGRPGRLRVRGERGLSPEEKVRFRYARLANSHPEWKASGTARENLTEGASVLYERVRYGEESITREEAEAWDPAARCGDGVKRSGSLTEGGVSDESVCDR